RRLLPAPTAPTGTICGAEPHANLISPSLTCFRGSRTRRSQADCSSEEGSTVRREVHGHDGGGGARRGLPAGPHHDAYEGRALHHAGATPRGGASQNSGAHPRNFPLAQWTEVHGPAAEPGLHVREGPCVLSALGAHLLGGALSSWRRRGGDGGPRPRSTRGTTPGGDIPGGTLLWQSARRARVDRPQGSRQEAPELQRADTGALHGDAAEERHHGAHLWRALPGLVRDDAERDAPPRRAASWPEQGGAPRSRPEVLRRPGDSVRHPLRPPLLAMTSG